jgi:hypothetical protein
MSDGLRRCHLIGVTLGVLGLASFTGCQKQAEQSLRPSASPEKRQPPPASADAFLFAIEDGTASISRYVGSDNDVVIPEMLGDRPVAAIGNDAFKGNQQVITIRFPPSLTRIGQFAFCDCSHLDALDLPPRLVSIGSNAFQSLPDLKTVTLPASLTDLGAVCFFGCTSLKSINVDPANPVYTSIDGVVYDKEAKTLVMCPSGKEGVLEIPPTVTAIAAWAFGDCKKLSEVVIPPSVTEIHTDAFGGCTATRTNK